MALDVDHGVRDVAPGGSANDFAHRVYSSCENNVADFENLSVKLLFQ